VSEKTVYNYFPTKEQLALDQDEQIRDRLVELIRARPADTSPAAAVRDEVLTFVDEIRSIPPGQIRGELGYLAANSPTIRRLTLEMTDRRADAIAAAILDTTPRMAPPLAKPRAVALAWVFQTIIDESGRRIRDGQGPDRIANELHPIIEAILDDLDRWLSDPVEPPGDVR
jgi:AcrR family transcriptional regulator